MTLDELRSIAELRPEPEQGENACIEAYEQTKDCTKVDFENGRNPREDWSKCQPIEDALFDEFCQMIISEVWQDKGSGGRNPLTAADWVTRFESVEKVLEKKRELRISEEKAYARLGIAYSTFKDWKREWKRRKKDD